MGLQEPERKMSTTAGTPQGTVLIADLPDVVRKKFRSAVTDSGHEVRYDPEAKPGISNLIEIMSVVTGDSFADVERRYDGQGYGPFKADVAEAVVELLDPIRVRYEELRNDPVELQRLLPRRARDARDPPEAALQPLDELIGFVK